MHDCTRNKQNGIIGKYGKPFLLNSPHIHYNVSHTGDYVFCALADEPVRIDVELIKSVDLKIAKRFFAVDETIHSG